MQSKYLIKLFACFKVHWLNIQQILIEYVSEDVLAGLEVYLVFLSAYAGESGAL